MRSMIKYILTERDPVSVGFLHTPNFAAFWPKPRKKRMCWYHANSSPPYPPPAKVRLLSKTEKNIEKSKDSGTMCWYHANSSPPYPPCRCQAPVPKPKKHREIERFCPKPKKLDKSKKQKNQRFWDNVLVSCKHSVGQIGFFGFFDFSRFLSVLDKIFRFLVVFLILDGFFRILNVFLILDTFFWFLDVSKAACSKSFNTGQLCKKELRRFSNTKQQENQRCGQPDNTASGDSKPDRVLSFQPACTQPQPS